MKHDWKKQEKTFYAPKSKPEQVYLPAMNFFSIRGEGNPNHPAFAEYIAVLYSLSYAVKMSPKSGHAPTGYYEYSVYPLKECGILPTKQNKNRWRRWIKTHWCLT